MAIASVNGIELYYEVMGQGEPLVLIAGLGARRDCWNSILYVLAQKYQVIVFDNRGIGETDCPQGPYSIELMAEDVVALLGELGIQQANFIGHSMGGAILQCIAAKHAELVNQLIIYSSGLRLRPLIQAAFNHTKNLHNDGASPEMIFKSILPWCFGNEFIKKPENVVALVEYTIAHPYPQTKLGYVEQLAAINKFDGAEYVALIQQPCLVLAGEFDLCNPVDEVKELAEAIPQAEFKLLPNVGHMGHIENANVFLERVSEFFG